MDRPAKKRGAAVHHTHRPRLCSAVPPSADKPAMPRPGHVIALCVIALLTMGVVMVNSAQMAVTPASPDGEPVGVVDAETILFSRTALYMVLAVAAMAFGAVLPIRRLRGDAATTDGRRELVVLGVCSAVFIGLLLLAFVPGIGRNVNGAYRWLRLPIPGLGDALSVQPSEIAKWGLVAVVAWYAARRANLMPDFLRGLAPALAAIAAVCAVVVLEDFGTGVLIGAATCIILLAAGARLWQFALFVPFAALGLAVALLTSPYRVKRLTAFLDPYADPERTGYHMIQSMLAVSGGEGWGRGLGFGLQKFGYLPEDHNDFLFAVICEELGIAGAATTIAIYIALVWAGFAIVRREREPFLRLLALGIIATIGLQALINLTVVTGLGPTKGIALPLVSSGGTGWLLTALSLGVLIAIDRTRPRDDTVVA